MRQQEKRGDTGRDGGSCTRGRNREEGREREKERGNHAIRFGFVSLFPFAHFFSIPTKLESEMGRRSPTEDELPPIGVLDTLERLEACFDCKVGLHASPRALL